MEDSLHELMPVLSTFRVVRLPTTTLPLFSATAAIVVVECPSVG